MKQMSLRETALDTLMKIEKQQTYSNLLLNEMIKKGGMKPVDRPLFTQLVYGTLQYKKRLDFELEKRSSKPLHKLDLWVLVLLRISLYQLRFLERVPDHAVLNEAVTIAKSRGHKGISGMVNGVLRSCLREGPRPFTEAGGNIEQLAVETSHPEWMIKRWISQLGFEQTKKLAEANNIPPKTTVRLTHLAPATGEVLESMEEDGLLVLKSSLRLNTFHIERGSAASAAAFKKGWIAIQDEASMLAGDVVSPEDGEKILDSCAAPGGKSLHIASLAPGAEITAVDLHPHKVNLIEKAAERQQISNITTLAADARKMELEPESFDKILVDAPCSGLGVLRRKPDMKWTKKEEDITRLAAIQTDILRHVWPSLKPGGRLIYSTCTIDREENADQVRTLLQQTVDAQGEDVTPYLPEQLAPYISEEGMLELYPGTMDMDGFFIASVKKMPAGGGHADALS
ncbi:16S rRNA (cytosine(967)-C(5))-methyltransferase RsmB [Alkalicoccus urumqiensis]|uniref:16S rRNA (cytosine(967)-C(5))-methyltransferase n=1 Tax=Alkalicoccus urumqiensis TaxID=1548213 RepID=A0A2P6MG84_ALKUR|nr:16S rRNA (cytosine(967)-C(5))-methyltransferase RsmB [Alkalicoccus urumqiensis]PRO65277.1 16S rRNA (cytosine(967)-C(5))-methyltransferase [Alkalicoccus urumqiensis]